MVTDRSISPWYRTSKRTYTGTGRGGRVKAGDTGAECEERCRWGEAEGSGELG